MANEKFSQFPSEATISSGDLLVGLHAGENASFDPLSYSNNISINGIFASTQPVSQFVVSTSSTLTPYTSIQSAITAAGAIATATVPQTVWVLPGTYTENITVTTPYVNISAAVAGSVFIKGLFTQDATNDVAIYSNLNFVSTGAGAFLGSNSSGATLSFYNCYFNGVNSTSMKTENGTYNLYESNCVHVVANLGVIYNLATTTINVYDTNTFGTNVTSVLTGTTFTSYNCNFTDYFAVATLSSVVINNTYVSSGSQFCFYLTGSSTINFSGASLFTDATYLVSGDGGSEIVFTYGLGIAAIGMATEIDPTLNYNNTPALVGDLSFDNGDNYISGVTGTGSFVASHSPTFATAISTTPGNSASSSLILGTAYHNTTGNDVILIVYINVASATAASILSGVGSTVTPTQQTIIASISSAAFIPVTVYLPNNYYALISTSGTISASIAGQQITPV